MELKKLFFVLRLILILVLTTTNVNAEGPKEYLEKVYPNLTQIYEKDLGKCNAHYIFSVDISGTMYEYGNIMTPLLKNFIAALPNDDKVTIIPFGTDPINPFGFSVKITPETKKDLMTNIEKLYKKNTYESILRDHTNIYKAINAMSKAVQTNQDYKVNILVSFTDFLNNIPKVPPHTKNIRLLTNEELEEMQSNLKSAITGSYVRCIAVELYEEGDGIYKTDECGYCLNQLKNRVFNITENKLEIINCTNSKSTIEEWFEQLRRDIMVIKLKAIVESENKARNFKMKTEVDIDGNTKATICWNPGRLYDKMKIDSTYLNNDNFRFINNTENYTTTSQDSIEVELGQIKHNKLGFHYFNDTCNLGITLPTDFDDELKKLGIERPDSAANQVINRWIFTFPLPFWLTVTIVILLIIYFLLVIKAMIRNNKDKINGKIRIKDMYGNEVMPPRKLINSVGLTIGVASDIKIENAAWQLSIQKVKPSPFLLFKKPYFRWYSSKGHIATRNGFTEGKIDNYTNTKAIVECGKDRKNLTHKVEIQLIPMD